MRARCCLVLYFCHALRGPRPGWPDPAIFRKTCDFLLLSALDNDLRFAGLSTAILDKILRRKAQNPAVFEDLPSNLKFYVVNKFLGGIFTHEVWNFLL